jgi:ribosomal protein S18 acetylase RimI-like enzyme
LQQQSLIKYAKYIKEVGNRDLIESKYGFITYEVCCNSQIGNYIHICDLWIDPDYRGYGHAKDLTMKVIEEAKNMGARHITSSIQINGDITETLSKQLAFGFKVATSNEKEIKLIKELCHG